LQVVIYGDKCFPVTIDIAQLHHPLVFKAPLCAGVLKL